MLTIPMYVGWELARTRNVTSISNPMVRYKPDGDAAREETYRLSIFQLRDNSYKFIPVTDGYVSYTGPDGAPVKSSMSYEGFKQILAANPYLILLSKVQRGMESKPKVFAAFMTGDVGDERALKIQCLKYAKSINVTGTKHRITTADTQRKRMYDWEDLAFMYEPQGALPRTADKRAFDERNASYYADGKPTGTKARYAALTTQKVLSRDDAKLLIRYIAQAYGIDITTLKVRFTKPVRGRSGTVLGVAHGQFEDFYDTAGNRGLAITLMHLSPHVIMHEMAHIVSYKYYSRAEGGTHGDRFAGVYAHILDHFCPWVAPNKALAFMRAGGLKVHPFDPSQTAAPPPQRPFGSHRDFEQAHAIVANPNQNRRIERPFERRAQWA